MPPEGNYGQVFQGTANGLPAAIKVVRESRPKPGHEVDSPEEAVAKKKAHMADLRQEIALMQQIKSFGQHPNLIKVLAYDDGPDPKLALEVCAQGSLLEAAMRVCPKFGDPDQADVDAWHGLFFLHVSAVAYCAHLAHAGGSSC